MSSPRAQQGDSPRAQQGECSPGLSNSHLLLPLWKMLSSPFEILWWLENFLFGLHLSKALPQAAQARDAGSHSSNNTHTEYFAAKTVTQGHFGEGLLDLAPPSLSSAP